MESPISAVQTSRMARIVGLLGKFTTMLSKWLYWIAGAGLILMLALVVADIIGIKLIAHPIPGGIELTGFLGAVVIGFAIAFVQIMKGHIQVDFLTMRLSPRPKAIIDVFMTFFGIVFFAVLAWRSLDYGRVMQLSGEVSMTQRIPFFPFIYSLAFCYFVACLVLLVDFCKAVMKVGVKWTR
jgi:TRAP-type C4-dicarboxylate transport system permease small subunit